MEILKPSFESIVKMAQTIEKGAVALLPSDVAYALVTNPFSEPSLKKMREIIEVPPNFPVQIFVHPSDIEKYADTSAFTKKVLNALLPAAMVLILRKKPNVLNLLAPGLSTVGVSWNEEPTIAAVYNVIGIPLAFTRAAKPGAQLCRDFESAKVFGEGIVDIAMDCGSTKYKEGIGGTIIDMSSDDIKILREGVFPATKVNEIINRIRKDEGRS